LVNEDGVQRTFYNRIGQLIIGIQRLTTDFVKIARVQRLTTELSP